jgi:PEP-CTERM motif
MISLPQAGRTVLVVAALCAPSATHADLLGQASTPNGSAFVDACAGLGYSSDIQPGIAWAGNPFGGTNCGNATGASVSQAALATGSAAPNPFPYQDMSSASASIGHLHLDAGHTGDSGYYFPEAYADAGWNDTLTPNVTNLFNVMGTTGIWVIPITVSGIFATSGPDAGADGYVDIFQNGQEFSDRGTADDAAYSVYRSSNAPLLSDVANGFPGASWSKEMIGWSATSRYGASYAILDPSTTIYFALPVTLGQSYSLGIWADVSAGEYSAGAAGPALQQDIASADMSNSILWGGPGYFIDGAGDVHTDVTITSGSGYNYNVAATDSAAVPEPSSIVLALSGVGLLALASRRRGKFRN